MKRITAKLFNVSPLVRFHRNPTLIGRNNFSTETDKFLPAYVDQTYSYSYGRSKNCLLYKTIGQAFEERSITYNKNKPMIVSHHENIKKYFDDFYDDVNKLVKAFHENLGLKRGDVIGVWSGNTYDWILIQYASARLGTILCTVNPFYKTYELDYLLRKSEIKTFFMPGKHSKQEIINTFYKTMINVLEKNNKNENQMKLHLENIVTLDGECFSSSDIPSGNNIKLFEFEKLKYQSGELNSSILDQVSPDDPVMIMFTSGTTGRPKGACLSHFCLLNNVILSGSKQFNNDTNLCLALPFFHAFAGVLGNLSPLISENNVQLVIPCLKYDVKQLVDAMNEHKVTTLFATPTLTIDLFNYLRNNNLKLTTLNCVMAGGASVPLETVHQFIETVPSCKTFRIGYGATETGPCSTICTPMHTHQECIETVGSALDFVEIKLIDPKTKSMVKIGETGEIHVRGHNIMSEYWKEPEKTKEVIAQGWYNTGDLGVMNEKGLLKIIGRTKELIIVGGENVYPREIEEILYTHPAVEIANVIGVPDERKGEEICAWIQLHKNAKATEEELKKFCQEKLTYFKVPKYYLFVNEFPMTATGKAQKFLMQEITIKKLNLKTSKQK